MNKKFFNVKTLAIFAATLVVVGLGAIGIIAEAAKNPTEPGTIAQSITINGIDVAGMDEAAAKAAVADYVNKAVSSTFTLKSETKEFAVTGDQLGITANDDEVVAQAISYGTTGNILERYVARKRLEAGKNKDFEISFSADKNTVATLLDENEANLVTQAENASLTRKDGKFVYKEGTDGYAVKKKASVNAICSYISDDWDCKDASIALKTKITEPKGDEKSLSKIKDELGTYSTSYAGSDSGRRINIENGASFVNGTVVYPGEEFSTTEKLDPQTVENGYAAAGSYENGKTVQSIGGGVCQISTTLYNAVIRAELEVTERQPHSMMVGYVKPAADAAISEGAKDLKFKNNLKYPIYIEMYGDGATLTATIYGVETRPANRTVEFESEVLATISPTPTYVSDPSQPIGYRAREGESHTGYKACLWKIVTVDGVEESREKVNTSSYRATHPTIIVGTGSENPDVQAAMEAAVAGGDDAGMAAAAAADAEAAAAAEAEAAAAAEAGENPEGAPAEGEAPAPEEQPAEAPAEEPAPAE